MKKTFHFNTAPRWHAAAAAGVRAPVGPAAAAALGPLHARVWLGLRERHLALALNAAPSPRCAGAQGGAPRAIAPPEDSSTVAYQTRDFRRESRVLEPPWSDSAPHPRPRRVRIVDHLRTQCVLRAQMERGETGDAIKEESRQKRLLAQAARQVEREAKEAKVEEGRRRAERNMYHKREKAMMAKQRRGHGGFTVNARDSNFGKGTVVIHKAEYAKQLVPAVMPEDKKRKANEGEDKDKEYEYDRLRQVRRHARGQGHKAQGGVGLWRRRLRVQAALQVQELLTHDYQGGRPVGRVGVQRRWQSVPAPAEEEAEELAMYIFF